MVFGVAASGNWGEWVRWLKRACKSGWPLPSGSWPFAKPTPLLLLSASNCKARKPSPAQVALINSHDRIFTAESARSGSRNPTRAESRSRANYTQSKRGFNCASRGNGCRCNVFKHLTCLVRAFYVHRCMWLVRGSWARHRTALPQFKYGTLPANAHNHDPTHIYLC